MTSRGVDVSSYQRPADWRSLSPEFVLIKASEGAHTRDSAYPTHLAQAVSMRSVAGAYHFGWPINDAQDDVNNFAAVIAPAVTAGQVQTVALDLEPYPDRRNVKGLTAGHIQDWAARWRDFARVKFPHLQIGCYADLSVFGQGWVPGGFDYYWAAEYRGGMTYSRAEASDWPLLGPGFPKPLFWQFNSSPLDMDLCSLDAADLRKRLAGSSSVPPAPKPSAPAPTYTVVWGDTLTGIAAAHGISLADLEHANPQVKNPNVITVGQKLTLPHGAQKIPTVAKYKVRKGDTMTAIATAHGVSLTALERANPQVKNPNLITIGQTLTIPGRS